MTPSDSKSRSTLSNEVYEIVARIPKGKVTSYSAIGRILSRPISGLLVGNIMDHCPQGLPWWRVIGAKGDILVAKKSPYAGLEQVEKLSKEGIEVADNIVVIGDHFWDPF